MTWAGRHELNMGCLKARGGYNCLGELQDRTMGELWSTVVVCGEDSNSAWVKREGDPVSMGEMGGMGGPVVP